MASLIADEKPTVLARAPGLCPRQAVAGFGKLELDGGEPVVLDDPLTARRCPTLDLAALAAATRGA